MATHKIYIDSCCLIDLLKGDAGVGDPAREREVDMLRRVIRAARDEKIIAYVSLFTVAEVVRAGDAPIDEDFKRKVERLIMSGRDGLQVVGITPRIASKARDLAWEDGLGAIKPPDRVHLASAAAVGAKEFLSSDNRLGKKVNKANVSGIRLIAPSDTLVLPSEYLANDFFKKP